MYALYIILYYVREQVQSVRVYKNDENNGNDDDKTYGCINKYNKYILLQRVSRVLTLRESVGWREDR